MFSRVADLTHAMRRTVVGAGLGKFATAVIDQVLVSGTGFWVGMYIAGNFSKAEYGFYIMVITVSHVLISYQNALFNTPLLVLMPEAGQGYVCGAERLNRLLACMTILCAATAVPLAGLKALFPALLFGVLLVKEFYKNVLYSELNMIGLLRVDALHLLIMGIVLTVGFKAWWLIFPALLVGHACSLLCCGYTPCLQRKEERVGILKVAATNWDISRWSLVGVTATVMQNRSYVYLTTTLLCPEVLADLSVTRMVMMPLALCVGSSGKIVVVWGRRLLCGGDIRSFYRGVGVLIAFLSTGALFYLTLVYWAYPFLNDYFFYGKYDGLQRYIILWGVYFIVQMFRFVLSNSLQAMCKFRELAMAGVLSGTLAPVLSFALILHIGGCGSLVALICAELVLLGYLIRVFRGGAVGVVE